MDFKINDKLHTRDGRKIGNAFITGLYKAGVRVVTEEGKDRALSFEQIEKLFFRDEKIEIKLLNEVVDIASESGMSLELLRKILYEKIEDYV